VIGYAHGFRRYPSRVVFVDGRDGDVLGEYWHPGYLTSQDLADVDGDGENEILLGGINNPGDGLGHAALAILEVPPGKASPRGEGFFGKISLMESAYLLFPEIDVLSVRETHAFVASLDAIAEQQRILARVRDEPASTGGVLYELDYDLNLVSVQPSNDTRSLHEQLYEDGTLDHRLTARERESWAVLASFPRAPNGNSEEVKLVFERLQERQRGD